MHYSLWYLSNLSDQLVCILTSKALGYVELLWIMNILNVYIEWYID